VTVGFVREPYCDEHRAMLRESQHAHVVVSYTTKAKTLEVVKLQEVINRLWKQSKGLEDAVQLWRESLAVDMDTPVSGELVATLTSGQVVVIRW
jgi:hypothetical protein